MKENIFEKEIVSEKFVTLGDNYLDLLVLK